MQNIYFRAIFSLFFT